MGKIVIPPPRSGYRGKFVKDRYQVYSVTLDDTAIDLIGDKPLKVANAGHYGESVVIKVGDKWQSLRVFLGVTIRYYPDIVTCSMNEHIDLDYRNVG